MRGIHVFAFLALNSFCLSLTKTLNQINMDNRWYIKLLGTVFYFYWSSLIKNVKHWSLATAECRTAIAEKTCPNLALLCLACRSLRRALKLCTENKIKVPTNPREPTPSHSHVNNDDSVSLSKYIRKYVNLRRLQGLV